MVPSRWDWVARLVNFATDRPWRRQVDGRRARDAILKVLRGRQQQTKQIAFHFEQVGRNVCQVQRLRRGDTLLSQRGDWSSKAAAGCHVNERVADFEAAVSAVAELVVSHREALCITPARLAADCWFASGFVPGSLGGYAASYRVWDIAVVTDLP